MPFSDLDSESAVVAKLADCVETSLTGWDSQMTQERADLAFAFNEQWSDRALSIRRKAKRPAYVFNVVDRLVDHVSGQARMNPGQINLRPAGAGSSRFTALLAEAILRGIQRDHSTVIAKAWALECAARVGRGYFRIMPEWEHPHSFDMVLRYRRIPDPFSVLIDPLTYQHDGTDFDWAILMHWLTDDEYESAYGSLDGVSSATVDPRILERWYEEDTGRIRRLVVAEFYWREVQKKWLVEYADGAVEVVDSRPDEDSSNVIQFREWNEPRTRFALVSGHKQLSKTVDWPSPRIPVYPVWGREIIGDGKREVKSVIRNTRDPQKIVNSTFTSAAETIAAMVKAPFVGSWASVEKYWNRFWKRSNDPTTLLLPYDADPDLPDGGRPKRDAYAPNISGQSSMLAQALDLVRWTSGVGEEATGIPASSSQSGRALIASAQFSDVNTFVFHDNLTRAEMSAGEDLLHNLLPAFYSGPRLVRAVFSEDQLEPLGDVIGINGKEAPDQEQIIVEAARRAKIELPPDYLEAQVWGGRYSVAVTPGKAYPTRRIEAQENLLGLLPSIPQEYAALLIPILLETSDWPGAAAAAEAIRAAFPQAGPAGELPPGAEGAPPPEGGNGAAPPELVNLVVQIAQEVMASQHQTPEFAQYVRQIVRGG